MTRRGRVAAVVAATVAALLATSGDVAVAALFSSVAGRPSGSFSTATLQPASNVGVTWWCPGGGGGGYTATISWDPSASPFVQDYVVEWAPSASGQWTVLSTTTSTAVQQTSIPKKTDRWWRVTSAAYAWRSAAATVAASSPNAHC